MKFKTLRATELIVFIIMIAIVIGGLFTMANAAELIGKDYPYWIFRDNGLIRYCFEPEDIGQYYTRCWAKGIETQCVIVPEAYGYIDCGKPE